MKPERRNYDREHHPSEIGWRDGVGPYVETGAAGLDSLRFYIWEINRIAMLPFYQEQFLFDEMLEGNQSAKDRLILAHLRMVPRIADRYSEFGLSVLDLIQDGNLGLQKAVEKFDHRRGYRLASYAPYLIEAEIKRAIANTSRTIRIPVHAQQKLAKIRRAERLLVGELFREPTIEEVAECCPYGTEEIAWLKSIAGTPASLSAPVHGEAALDLVEHVTGEMEISPEEEFIDAESVETLTKAIGCLEPRERQIVEGRWGVGGEESTLEELGDSLGLTRERVRQLEAGAMAKLREILVGHGVADRASRADDDCREEFVVEGSRAGLNMKPMSMSLDTAEF